MNIIVKLISVMLKVTLSLAMGALLSVSLFKNDERVREVVAEKVTPFLSHLIGGDVACRVKHISFFPLAIELESVKSLPWQEEQGLWQWSCPSLTIGASWFDLLFYGTVALTLDMDSLNITTRLDKHGLCVWKIISRIISAPPTIPTYVHTITIPNGHLQIDEPSNDMHASLDYDMTIRKKNTRLVGDIVVHRADAVVHKRPILQCLRGPLSFTSRYSGSSVLVGIKADCSVDLPHLPGAKTCRIFGEWNEVQGEFSVTQATGERLVDSLKLRAEENGLRGDMVLSVPLAYVYGAAMNTTEKSPLTGQCSATITAYKKQEGVALDASVHVSQVCYAGIDLASTGTLVCRRDCNAWSGTLSVHKHGAYSVKGSVHWDEATASGSCHLNNDQQLVVPGITDWSFLPKSIVVQAQRDAQGAVRGKFLCAACNAKTGSIIACDMSGSLIHDSLELNGLIDNKSLRVECSVGPQIILKQCVVCDAQHAPLISLHSSQARPDHFSGKISLAVIKELLKRAADIDFQGQGMIECAGFVRDKKLFTQLKLVNGSVRIPYTCNLINGAQARLMIDPGARLAHVRDLRCSLYRGSVTCPLAAVTWDHSYAVTGLSAPLVLRDCLLNWKRDLFALLSGKILMTKDNDYLCSGDIVIDRAQLKKNIFAQEFQKNFIGNGARFSAQKKAPVFNLDLHVSTKNPVRIKTALLETSAKTDLFVKGRITQPELAGRITLLSGSLNFPYKPLYISKGFLDFTPGRLSEPYFEISARNKLKKYNVSLEVSGTPSEQDIVLEASPTLTEEQIVALLLVGSEQGSLNILVPALIMQNLKGIIFGSDQSPTGVRKSFGRLLKPLERIHLVPSFTDQTGRGGLRAAVEIDVNDRCRAMIQKNFSLTEDTKVEVDYALSDDVNIRGVRDERGDIGAEIEMRWKF